MFRIANGLVVLALIAMASSGATAGHAAAPAAGKCSTAVSTKVGRHTMVQSSGSPVFTFGLSGGNIRPWTVEMYVDGTVRANGITARDGRMQSPSDTLNSLLDLAAAEGFWGMPGFTHCSGTLPDAAAHFVQITSNTGTTRVTVHGSCNSSFNRIWANLNAVVDLTR